MQALKKEIEQSMATGLDNTKKMMAEAMEKCGKDVEQHVILQFLMRSHNTADVLSYLAWSLAKRTPEEKERDRDTTEGAPFILVFSRKGEAAAYTADWTLARKSEVLAKMNAVRAQAVQMTYQRFVFLRLEREGDDEICDIHGDIASLMQ